MIEIELGRTIPLSFRGQLGPGAFRPSPALVAPWTRAVSFSPRSISTKYSSAKPRGILLKNLSTMLKNLSAAPRGFEHCLEVFESIYFSYQKSHRAISYTNSRAKAQSAEFWTIIFISKHRQISRWYRGNWLRIHLSRYIRVKQMCFYVRIIPYHMAYVNANRYHGVTTVNECRFVRPGISELNRCVYICWRDMHSRDIHHSLCETYIWFHVSRHIQVL